MFPSLMVQPQPHAGSTLQWEMNGEEAVGAGSNGSLGPSSQGSLRVPPEMAGNELLVQVMDDNYKLREALKRSTCSLRDRCGEMESWQRKAKEEREFLSCRFREAKSLVERLAEENKVLLGKLNHNTTTTTTNGSSGPGSRTKTTLAAAGSQAAAAAEQDAKNPQADRNGLQDGCCSLESAQDHLDADRDDLDMRRSLPAEGSNEFLQLLKAHKLELEGNLRELRGKNAELEAEKVKGDKERDNLRTTVEQLQARLGQLSLQPGGSVMAEAVQRSDAPHPVSESPQITRLKEELTATQGRYKELQVKVDGMMKNSVHRDRAEAQLKQKEKDCAQLAKDSDSMKAQVTSLLGELQERQTCLEKSEEKRRELEEKLGGKMESLQGLERDIERERRQHTVTVDKLLMQVQNLEAALKNDRLVITEERRKLAQLQHAYTCLFQDYDAKLKAESQAKHRCGASGEVGDLANRLVEAEKALALKQDLIDKLKEEVEQQRSTLETVPVLTAQAEIYKADFLAEREAREKLNQTKEELSELLNKAKADIERLKQEGSSRAQLEAMKYRHQHVPAPAPFNQAQPPQAFPRAEEQPDYRCPKCGYQAPDMDTLQIHVMDCIQ
ncbi:NF-kappa-B essential modulator isoform X3 [Engraulis encrasicolus]|uniref:NF-kappa-B essential modulator isoform X3 n=1 Tax=Engraulis encrasicolus TaxID=184585 RepID=UPI002FCF2158